MASAVVGVLRAAVVMLDSGWFAVGDSNLLWLQWSHDIGVKRMLLSVPLALLLSRFAGSFALFKIFHTRYAAIACALLALLPHIMVAANVPAATTQPSVVLITLDSVRLDHLGWGGSELPTSPKLDSLAARGVRFTQSISQSSWTKPATATLLTGMVPSKHNANSRYGALANSQRTLGEAFSLAGYRTHALSSNPNVSPTFGFGQGFELMLRDVAGTAEQLVARGKQWLENNDGQSSFLYLHLNDAHYPYQPSADYAGLFNKTGIDTHLDGKTEEHFRTSYGEGFSEEQVESLRLSYAEEIRYLDDIVGDFVNELLDSRDDIIVVITSDHGEEFLEHGDLGHGHTLYDELIRVPLQFVMSDKLMDEHAWQIGLHTQQVRQMDVMPTILEMCAMPWPHAQIPLDGSSLLNFFGKDANGISNRNAMSETDSQGSALSGYAGPLRSYRMPQSKLIISDPYLVEKEQRAWLFDLNADPREVVNIAKANPQQVAAMYGAYQDSGWLLPHLYNSSASANMSEQEKAQLAAMGYTDDAEGDSTKEVYFDPRAVPWVEIELDAN